MEFNDILRTINNFLTLPLLIAMTIFISSLNKKTELIQKEILEIYIKLKKIDLKIIKDGVDQYKYNPNKSNSLVARLIIQEMEKEKDLSK